MRVKIYGTGSASNHLAHSCRSLGWDVFVVGRSEESLRRMREDIYPGRYGSWDDAIKLYCYDTEPVGEFDCIFIGTAPESHLFIALRALLREEPAILHIEKPLCPPHAANLGDFLAEMRRHPKTKIVVGYNHTVSVGAQKVRDIIRGTSLGEPLAIDVHWREQWGGALAAHPWFSGLHDSYFGFFERGGGASGERAHGLHLWQYIAHLVGADRVKEVSAVFDFLTTDKVHYDRQVFLTLTAGNGLTGRVVLDTVSSPEEKKAAIQFEKGRIEWGIGKSERIELFEDGRSDSTVTIFPRTRSGDFTSEITHIADLFTGKAQYEESPLCLSRGLETVCVLDSAHRSHKEKRSVEVDYC